MPVDVKGAVAAAFLEMAARKDVDKITVKDLVEACGISRQTFYYHFRDIVDVLEWTARQGVERLLAQSLKASSPREALGRFVDFAAESQPMVRRLLNSQRREAMERIMVEATRAYLERSAREWGVEPSLNQADWQVTLDFYACGMAGLLLGSDRRRVQDRDQLADQLARLLKGTLGHVNLIPLNDVEESPLKPSRRVAAFQKRLERQGVTVTVRRKLGSDIDASCGQLRRKAMQSAQGMGGQTTNRKEDEVP